MSLFGVGREEARERRERGWWVVVCVMCGWLDGGLECRRLYEYYE